MHVTYDELSMCLRVEFDTRRVTVFQSVPKSIADALRDSSARDAGLIVQALGNYAWTDCSARSYSERNRMHTQEAGPGDFL